MSPLRKGIKNKNATKSPRHEYTQRIDNQRIALYETLSLCVFVAIKSLFGVGSCINNYNNNFMCKLKILKTSHR